MGRHELAEISNQQLGDNITLLAGQINAANYRFLKLIAEFDQREAWNDGCIRSCAHWLNWKCGIVLSAAREKVRVARHLDGLPKINQAFSEGVISYSKVRAMTRIADENNEAFLMDIATQGTASHMEALVSKFQLVKRLDTQNNMANYSRQHSEKIDQEEIHQQCREMISYQDDDGMWIIHAKLPAESGALVVKAIDAILKQANNVMSSKIETENVSAETLFEESSSPTPIIPFSKRRADALIGMAEHFLATATKDPSIATLAGSERCQIMLHVDIKTLQEQNSAEHHKHCNFDNKQWISPDTATRLCCDASLITVLEDDKGNVLNIGRRSRTIPPSIQRALSLRDTTCRVPGCCNNTYLDAHHIKHWADGGETKMNNLVMLCRHHHRQLHKGIFSIQVTDAKLVFTTAKGKQLKQCFFPQFDEMTTVHGSEQYLNSQWPDIDSNTAITQWRGEKLDYNMAMDELTKKRPD